jgi:uridine kinase
MTALPFIIGVAGGSGSGKTTVTQKVLDVVGFQNTTVIEQDNYYLDQSHLSFEARLQTNYDHPNAFDWTLMIKHIEDLQRGEIIHEPLYNFSEHVRSQETIVVKPASIIVIEGILALYEPTLRQLMSLKIFVDTDSDVRFIRRLQRDVRERGRSMESVIMQYEKSVRPMHLQFVEPSKRFADVILPNGSNEAAIDMIGARIAQLRDRIQTTVI